MKAAGRGGGEEMMAIRVIVVEDDSRLRAGLSEMVNSDPACTCVGAFG